MFSTKLFNPDTVISH